MSPSSPVLLLLIVIAGLLALLLWQVLRAGAQIQGRLSHLENMLSLAADQGADRIEDRLRRESRNSFHQLEAYLSLRDRLELRQGLPYTPHWSASPDFLKLIVEHCLEARPSQILECSSGLTTLMLARACQLNGDGRVVSLESGAEYAEKTRGHLGRYGLEEVADVRQAPLTPIELGGEEYLWYDLEALPSGPIDMLVIDGPPGYIQARSRYPALPLLLDRLAEDCVVFLDDAAREDEKAIVALWQAAYPKIQHEYIETERGCAVIRVRRLKSAS
jgi:predicted O-methyltransferase YrrM